MPEPGCVGGAWVGMWLLDARPGLAAARDPNAGGHSFLRPNFGLQATSLSS